MNRTSSQFQICFYNNNNFSLRGLSTEGIKKKKIIIIIIIIIIMKLSNNNNSNNNNNEIK